jgi:GR25 family glycosyltransferase involved in LPS biosynthesis
MRHHCFSQTFINLFKQALELNVDNIVVFEDDFAIYENGLQNIENSLSQIKSNNLDWDLIYFGGYIRGETATKVDENLLNISGALTTHGVGISRRIMEHTVENFTPFVDCSLDIWLSLKLKKFNSIYCTYPFSTYQIDKFGSDLDARFHTSNLDHWKRNFFLGKIV